MPRYGTCLDCGTLNVSLRRDGCANCYAIDTQDLVHPGSPIQRLMRRVHRASNGCWLYGGYIAEATGYGFFAIGRGKGWTAHRSAYHILVGPIPPGTQVDHTCHNDDPMCVGGKTCLHRRCVNPDHLEAVAGRINTLRSLNTRAACNAGKTRCKNGHDFTPQNTRVVTRVRKDGSVRFGRQCKECARAAMRRYEASGRRPRRAAV